MRVGGACSCTHLIRARRCSDLPAQPAGHQRGELGGDDRGRRQPGRMLLAPCRTSADITPRQPEGGERAAPQWRRSSSRSALHGLQQSGPERGGGRILAVDRQRAHPRQDARGIAVRGERDQRLCRPDRQSRGPARRHRARRPCARGSPAACSVSDRRARSVQTAASALEFDGAAGATADGVAEAAARRLAPVPPCGAGDPDCRGSPRRRRSGDLTSRAGGASRRRLALAESRDSVSLAAAAATGVSSSSARTANAAAPPPRARAGASPRHRRASGRLGEREPACRARR